MKRRCELCDQRATMHCESDQANLCWSCDEKVHGANFLVAKHARTLLCHVCQAPTPWTAAGQKLGPTVSVCESCRRISEEKMETGCRGGARGDIGDDGCSRCGDDQEAEDCGDNDVNEMFNDDAYGDEDEYEEEEEVEDEEEEDEEEEDGDNQVVPWSCDSPPPAASSSTEDESTNRSIAVAGDGLFAETTAAGGLTMKRSRSSEDLDSDDEIGCVSSGLNSRTLDNDEATSSSALVRPTKQRRAVATSPIGTSGGLAGAESLMNALKRLQRSPATEGNAAATVASICRLSGYHQSR